MERIFRAKRVRFKLKGAHNKGRMRLNVFRSDKHIYCQIIDDSCGKTLISASSIEKGFSEKGYNVNGAIVVGKTIGERAQAKGIKKVVFDRGPFKYHGRVKALADGAREYLEF